MPIAMTTCCVCKGQIPPASTRICKTCQRPVCDICRGVFANCLRCVYKARKGLNRGKIMTGSFDPLPNAQCDGCGKTMQGDLLAFCPGPCLQRFCHTCVADDAVQCKCPPVGMDE